MIKALFLDFYGTVVRDDRTLIQYAVDEIFRTGSAGHSSEVMEYLWEQFRLNCASAYGESFQTQREIEYRSLLQTIAHFDAAADADALCQSIFDAWRKPELFDDSREFFHRVKIPVYIVSNIDSDDVRCAVENCDLSLEGIFTSEDAKAYKPNPELFWYALRQTGRSPDEVLHVGDSPDSDIRGARAAGIRAVWLNRDKKPVPEGITAAGNLLELFCGIL
jgi:2-haloalkanoic acid dehalogenase type II